nr:MAG TPA: hypothetical protein [Caudoviricetes sp.]
MLDTIINRTKGKFPLSIPTSLAFESLMNIHDDLKHRTIPIFQYKVLWVNVHTLLRNMINACGKDDRVLLHANDLLEALLEEMEFIESFALNEAKGLRIRFYYSHYRDFERVYKHARLHYAKERNLTDHQSALQSVYTRVLDNLTKKLNNPALNKENQYVYVCENKIKIREYDKAIILTHFVYDLLSYHNFQSLDLIESHTGRIKKRVEWYTKMPQAKQYPNIPFSEPMIQIFGDNELFMAQNKNIRDEVLRIANTRRWHQLTSVEKMYNDVHHYANKDLPSLDGFFRDKISL